MFRIFLFENAIRRMVFDFILNILFIRSIVVVYQGRRKAI